MTQELSYFCHVGEDGGLQGLARKKLKKELRQTFAGKNIEIVIHRKKKHRSVQQNRVQWMYYTMISDVTGYTKDEIHSICKTLFLTTEKVNEKTGSVYSYTKSTTELSTVEHIEYTDQIKQWAAQEFEIVLPDPGEQMDFITHSEKIEGTPMLQG